MPTPSIPLSLPNFSFKLMSVSKLTRALKCYISFFPDFYLFQDLMTKQIIGRGREFGGICVAALVFIGTWFLRMSSFLRMSLSLHPRPTLVKGRQMTC